MARQSKKAARQDRRLRKLVRAVLLVLQELEHEQTEARARDLAAVDAAHI